MGYYDKFNLTQDDIDSGIEDFFTQLLIETKKQRRGAKKLEDLSSEKPKIIFVVGQPGAGKTTLSKYIRDVYASKGECSTEVNSDKIATYHRDYNELLKLPPDECYTITRQFVRQAEPQIYDRIRANKINIIKEATLTKGEKDYKQMQEFIDAGYEVEINIIAVDKYESFLSCIERDIKLLELGFDPRPVARINHDRMYEPLMKELMEIQKRGLSSRVNVYKRGKTLMQPQLTWKTGDNKYHNAHEALISERSIQREEIFKNPQRYLDRLQNARHSIEMMVKEEKMKLNYIEGLRQLEREFLNELSFSRFIRY